MKLKLSIRCSESPGIDGKPKLFYQKLWDIVGEWCYLLFFIVPHLGILFKELNNTIIARLNSSIKPCSQRLLGELWLITTDSSRKSLNPNTANLTSFWNSQNKAVWFLDLEEAYIQLWSGSNCWIHRDTNLLLIDIVRHINFGIQVRSCLNINTCCYWNQSNTLNILDLHCA